MCDGDNDCTKCQYPEDTDKYKTLAQELYVFAWEASFRIFGETSPEHPEYKACEDILAKGNTAGLRPPTFRN
jgi:hypothetical protein